MKNVIAFLNQKGGVGKTSTVFHTAGTLAARGHRVLVVDNDPQASLTQGIFGPDATASIDPAETIFAVYAGDRPAVESLAMATGIESLAIIAGSASLNDFNHETGGLNPGNQLAEILADASRVYDYVLIDCPPNLLACSRQALNAASGVVIPLMAEDYGVQGIAKVQAAIEAAREGNPGLTLLGLLITILDRRTGLQRFYEQQLRDTYMAGEIFEATIPRLIAFPEAVLNRVPVAFYPPKSADRARAAMTVFADELAARLGQCADLIE